MFFTNTGIALKVDQLAKALLISSALVATRLLAIVVGSWVGNKLAQEDKHCRSQYMWATFVTQAGVTLGLSKRVQLAFPTWGSYFSTMYFAASAHFRFPVSCNG